MNFCAKLDTFGLLLQQTPIITKRFLLGSCPKTLWDMFYSNMFHLHLRSQYNCTHFTHALESIYIYRSIVWCVCFFYFFKVVIVVTAAVGLAEQMALKRWHLRQTYYTFNIRQRRGTIAFKTNWHALSHTPFPSNNCCTIIINVLHIQHKLIPFHSWPRRLGVFIVCTNAPILQAIKCILCSQTNANIP